MATAYPQWQGFPMPQVRVPAGRGAQGPDHQTQLEEILSHVRRCEKWARIDDRIDLSWRLEDRT